jgi:hypothetical protein
MYRRCNTHDISHAHGCRKRRRQRLIVRNIASRATCLPALSRWKNANRKAAPNLRNCNPRKRMVSTIPVPNSSGISSQGPHTKLSTAFKVSLKDPAVTVMSVSHPRVSTLPARWRCSSSRIIYRHKISVLLRPCFTAAFRANRIVPYSSGTHCCVRCRMAVV